MRRRCISLLLVALLFCAAGDSGSTATFERGLYHRNTDFGFEMWLLAGFAPATPGAESEKTRFVNRAGAIRQISVREAPATTAAQYAAAVQEAAGRECKGCTFRVLEGETAGRYPAVLVLVQELGANQAYTDTEIISAGLDLGRNTFVDLTAFFAIGEAESALAELRWMLSTVRRSGEDGFDPYLASRRVDVETGLSYRPPRGFESGRSADPDSGPGIVYESKGLSGSTRMSITPATNHDLQRVITEAGGGMSRVGGGWASPHDRGAALRCALFATAEKARGRAVVAATVAPDHTFTIRVDGSFNQREFLTRTAELVGMSLDFVDVAAARANVAAASAALEAAVKNKRSDEVAAQARILARYAFLEKARSVLATSLPRIQDTTAQLAVIEALGATRAPEVAPQLIRCARSMKRKKRPAIVQAALTALGSAHTRKAAFLLLDFARRGTPAQAAAAIRALGRYDLEKKRIVRELIKLMVRSEAAGRKADADARARLEITRPALEEALLALTGHRFASGNEAKAWLRRR